jgi:hypothetical protein
MCTTLIALISSGERRPNWISLIVRKGHLDCMTFPGAMIAAFVKRFQKVCCCKPFYRWCAMVEAVAAKAALVATPTRAPPPLITFVTLP